MFFFEIKLYVEFFWEGFLTEYFWKKNLNFFSQKKK